MSFNIKKHILHTVTSSLKRGFLGTSHLFYYLNLFHGANKLQEVNSDTFLNLASFARGESFPKTISVTSEIGTEKQKPKILINQKRPTF